MNYSSSISTLSSSTSSFSDLEPSLSQTLTSSHSSSSSSSSSKKKNMVKGSVISAGAPSPRSVFYYDSLSDDEPRHFLDSCFLCNKVLSGHKDIFMYEGDKPFCSEDCRQKQMDFDEKKEQEEKMKLKLKMKMKMKSFSSSSSSSSSIKSFQRSSLIVNDQESTTTTTTTTTTTATTNESIWT